VIEGLGFVRLEVADLARSLAFYRDGLCFAPEPEDEASSNGRARLRAGRLVVVLVAAPGRPPRGRGVDLAVAVDGVDAYHDALVARGMAPEAPHDAAGGRAFGLVDPDGYRWRFVESLG